MHCSQFPCQHWKIKTAAFFFTTTPTPFQFGFLAEFSQKHFPHVALSLCIATLFLWEFRKQAQGSQANINMHFFSFFFLKVCAITFRERFFFFPFPMWQSFLQIVDIASKIFACWKKHVTDVFIPKSLLYCLPCPHTMRRSFVVLLVTRNSTERFLSRWRILRKHQSLLSH